MTNLLATVLLRATVMFLTLHQTFFNLKESLSNPNSVVPSAIEHCMLKKIFTHTTDNCSFLANVPLIHGDYLHV